MCTSRRRSIPLILALVAASLAACGRNSDPVAMFDDYVTRLGNVTGVELAPPTPEPVIPLYPRTRDLVLNEEALRVNVSTFLALGECGLLGEVSERNSALGRVQPVSSRLLYEIRLLRKLDACVGELAGRGGSDREFLEKLGSIRAFKAQQLPRVFWNASFASPEFRVFLSTATEPLQRDQQLVLGEVEEALGVLTRIGQDLTAAPPDPDRLERHYFHLQAGKPVGPLLQGMELSRRGLERASAILEETARAKKLCPLGKKTPRSEYLQNVFVRSYAGQVQPYLSTLHQQSRRLLERIHGLRQVQQVEPPQEFLAFYERWLDPESPDGLFSRFDRGLKRQTRAWQTLLQQCGAMPQGPADLR